MKKIDETKTLSVRRETLKELSLDDVRQVARHRRTADPVVGTLRRHEAPS